MVRPDMGMRSTIEAASYLKREPRIALRCEAVLVEQDGCTLDVVVTDVSRDGFKLESRSELEVGSQVILLVTKMPPVKALIRWTRGLEAGGVFLEAGAL
jgi:hypothetical protein